MLIRNWIILGVAIAAIAAYMIGAPSPISAEYSKTQQHYSKQTNECGNGAGASSHPSYLSLSESYENLVKNVYCSNTGSQVQGEENSIALSSSQR